ncbi:hypothetical protein O0L34_g8071 [Tuta absoluta]|nr:hypothetical protein O0L34_g8071 [Tuta absoluta]
MRLRASNTICSETCTPASSTGTGNLMPPAPSAHAAPAAHAAAPAASASTDGAVLGAPMLPQPDSALFATPSHMNLFLNRFAISTVSVLPPTLFVNLDFVFKTLAVDFQN